MNDEIIDYLKDNLWVETHSSESCFNDTSGNMTTRFTVKLFLRDKSGQEHLISSDHTLI